MAARCEPASTASTEFLAHFAAVERTRKPVTLSSLGPPPEPWHLLVLNVTLFYIVLNLCLTGVESRAHKCETSFVENEEERHTKHMTWMAGSFEWCPLVRLSCTWLSLSFITASNTDLPLWLSFFFLSTPALA